MTKIIFILSAICLFSTHSTQAFAQPMRSMPIPSSWLFASLDKQSVATKRQILEIQQLVIEEIGTTRPYEKSLEIINVKLQEFGLPTISPEAKVEVVSGNGIVATVEGATLVDDAYKFCLPCQRGWNQYVVGIIPVAPGSTP